MMLNRPTCGKCSVSTIRRRCCRKLVEAKSLAGSRCEHARRSQRPANDWTGFADNLREVVRLSRQEAQIRADAGGGSRYDALLDIFEPDMTSARLDSLFSDLKSWLPSLLSRAVEKQAKQTLIAPQGLSPLPNNGSWACRRCVSLALTSTAGASTSAPTRSAAAYPGCAHHHPLQRKRPAQRSVRRDPRNRPRPLRAESTSPVGRPARRTRPLHRYPRVAEPVFEMQLGRSERFLNRLLPAVRERFGDRPAFSRGQFCRPESAGETRLYSRRCR